MGSLRPLSTSNSQASNYSQINDMVRQINKEQATKTFKQPGGNAVVNGKLPYQGGYGSLFYNPDNIPTIVLGTLPDGTMGLVISKDGVSVLDVFA